MNSATFLPAFLAKYSLDLSQPSVVLTHPAAAELLAAQDEHVKALIASVTPGEPINPINIVLGHAGNIKLGAGLVAKLAMTEGASLVVVLRVEG
jgi:hypothetical protein